MLFSILTILIILFLNKLIPINKTDDKNTRVSKSLLIIALVLFTQYLLYGFKLINVLFTLILIYVVSMAKGEELYKIFMKDQEEYADFSRYQNKNNNGRVYNNTNLYSNIALAQNQGHDNGIIYTNDNDKLIRCELDNKFWLGKNKDPLKYCRKKLKGETLWGKIKSFFGF